VRTCPVCAAEWSDDTRFCPNDGSTLRAASGSVSLLGTVIASGYHIQRKLGEGGMGAVYLGEHVKMGRKSAIKVMTRAMARDPEAIARFNREAANAARIAHPNVCAIYDFGETDDGLIYLVMEFVEGESLSDLLRREHVLPLHRALTILKQTADALQAAHDLGIVHRDLKPDNIMLARDRDGGDVVKVVDFGIAKAMTGEQRQQVTKTGLVVGTPEYMSPEQLSGDVVDGRSDIYSLALVFYRLLTGTLPFQAESAQEMLVKRLTDDPLPLNRVAAGRRYSDELEQVMHRALAKMPADRYETAIDLARRAEHAAQSLTVASAEIAEAATQRIIPESDAAVPATRVSRPASPPTPRTPIPSASVRAPVKKKPAVAVILGAAVIAIGGGTAAVLLTTKGDTGPLPPAEGDSAGTAARMAPALEGDSASSQEVPTQQPPAATASGQRTVEDPPTAGGADAPTTLDTAALRTTLVDLGRQIAVEATRASAREQALALYSDPAVPAVMRGLAASVVAESYEVERPADACRWIESALALDPDNVSYRQYKTVILVGCGS
jgi:serine/threonine-protein kinase